ncbi:MAG: hypothetical protein ACLGIM_13970, partial [Alphaproteobacteria bacterium]
MVRRHIAGDARIPILAPCAADLVRFFIDDDVVKPSFPQLDRLHHACSTGADNRSARAICGFSVPRFTHCRASSYVAL